MRIDRNTDSTPNSNYYRRIDWIENYGIAKTRVKYSMIVTDYDEIAILRGKDGIIYFLFIGGKGIEPYLLRNKKDYDLDKVMDDDAILAYASDTPEKEIGYGDKDTEKYDLVVMDQELLDSIKGLYTDKIDKKLPEIQKEMDNNPRQKLQKGRVMKRKFGF